MADEQDATLQEYSPTAPEVDSFGAIDTGGVAFDGAAITPAVVVDAPPTDDIPQLPSDVTLPSDAPLFKRTKAGDLCAFFNSADGGTGIVFYCDS